MNRILGQPVIFCIGLSSVGVYLFFYGFKRLRLKRLIEDIPTSRIKSLAMGLVEIKGQALRFFKINTPFSDRPCVYYNYRVQEYKKNSKGSGGHWVTILRGDSARYPFFLTDQTGCALVNPHRAEVDLPWHQVYRSKAFQDPPRRIVDFLTAKGVNIKTWIFRKNIRVQEAYVMNKQPLYILGFAKPWKMEKGSEAAKKLKYLRWQKELVKLKKDCEELAKYDLNNDGTIDSAEWEMAKKKIARHVEEKFGSDMHGMTQVEQGPEKGIFYISDKSEKELLSHFGTSCVLSIIGGAVLSIGAIAFLLINLL